jgi:hypothetical protein
MRELATSDEPRWVAPRTDPRRCLRDIGKRRQASAQLFRSVHLNDAQRTKLTSRERTARQSRRRVVGLNEWFGGKRIDCTTLSGR